MPKEEASLKSIAEDVKQLKHDSRAHGSMLGLIMYSQAPEFRSKVVKALLDDRVLLELFTRVDGVATKDSIIKTVTALGLKGGGRASVYNKFADLEHLSVIEPVADVGKTGIYAKSVVSSGLRIEQDADFARAAKALKKTGK